MKPDFWFAELNDWWCQSLSYGTAYKEQDFPCGSAGEEFACNAGDLGSISGLGRSPGEGKGYPLQYSGLENSMDYTDSSILQARILEWVAFPFSSILAWRIQWTIQTPVFWPKEFPGVYSLWVTKSWIRLSDFHFTSLHKEQEPAELKPGLRASEKK